MGRFQQDLVQLCRGLWRDRVLAAAVIVCLAVGLGTQTLAIDLVDGLLLRAPAGVDQPATVKRLFLVERRDGGERITDGFPYPAYTALREQEVFPALTASARRPVSFAGGGALGRARADFVAASFLPLLGVEPVFGRGFEADETHPASPAPVAVLTHAFARRLFGEPGEALGAEVRIGGRPHTVIGVLPAGFRGLGLVRTDLLLPLGTLRWVQGAGWEQELGMLILELVARLEAPSRETYAEQRALDAFAAAFPGAFRAGEARVVLAPLQPGRGPLAPPESRLSLGLAVVAGVVLLIACLDVVALFVVRHLGRRRELAIRLALGAGRGGLLRLFLLEALVLATIAGALALLVVYAEDALLRSLLLPAGAAFAGPAPARVLGWTAGLVVFVALVTGLLPAARPWRRGLARELAPGGAAGARSRGHGRWGQALLVAQVALATLSVAALGWFAASLYEIRHADLGLEPDRVLVATAGAGQEEASLPDSELFARALERVRGLPGVESAALGAGVPLLSSFGLYVALPDRETPTLPTGGPYVNPVSEDFFATLGTALEQGRLFTTADMLAGAAPVVIVNRTLARYYWPGRSALGECLTLGEQPCARVVGVVEDPRRSGLREEPTFQLYVPLPQAPGWIEDRVLFVRTRDGRPPAELAAPLQLAVQELAGGRWIDVFPLAERLQRETRPIELGTALLGLFAFLALLLTLLGVYALAARSVVERRYELGVRLALGARSSHVRRLLLGRMLTFLVPGIALGLALALAGGRWAEPLLFGVRAAHPWVLAATAALLLLVTLAATWPPLRAALATPPTAALRE